MHVFGTTLLHVHDIGLLEAAGELPIKTIIVGVVVVFTARRQVRHFVITADLSSSESKLPLPSGLALGWGLAASLSLCPLVSLILL